MAKFRKKPVVVEAWQFDESVRPYPAPVTGRYIDPMGEPHYGVELDHPRDRWIAGIDIQPVLHTVNGYVIAAHGDWIIEGIQGDFYLRSASAFEATFEPVPVQQEAP